MRNHSTFFIFWERTRCQKKSECRNNVMSNLSFNGAVFMKSWTNIIHAKYRAEYSTLNSVHHVQAAFGHIDQTDT